LRESRPMPHKSHQVCCRLFILFWFSLFYLKTNKDFWLISAVAGISNFVSHLFCSKFIVGNTVYVNCDI
jgi:hypothetical protein